ncbi:heat shock 70 [Fusarium pseudoanthophilum]|uniref:Heat shock 70 n=1 Tax=Fusarium pseudoanthophilum TaxID=48495 RepID=A0A8H5PQP2_9HYPO|nr:heat shock 70 [Fusarium pseudoanthophilum]
MTRQHLVKLACSDTFMWLLHRAPGFSFSSGSSIPIPTDARNKATMVRTFWQLALFLAIGVISNFAAVLLVSFVRGPRSNSDLEAPDVAFTLTPELGKAALFIGYGSTAAFARVEGTPAYKDFMLRQNPSFATSDRSDDLQTPVSQVRGLNQRLSRQKNSTEEIDKAAVETVLRDLKAAVETYLGPLRYSVSSVKVAFPGHENNKDYRAHIIAGAVRQIGLVAVWAGPPRYPRLALLRKWLEEADPGKPEGLVLVIDNSKYGFYIALAYNDDGVMDIIRHKYHDYTGDENPSEKASLFQQALEEINKSPFDYISYGKKVPQTIEDLVIFGDDVWHPDFRNALDATLDSWLIRGANKRQPIYAVAVEFVKRVFNRLKDISVWVLLD